jgi:hypothetical protein
MSQSDDGKYGNDQSEDDSTVPYKSLPGHIRAACEVLHCCSTESSLRCDSFIPVSNTLFQNAMLPVALFGHQILRFIG